MLSISVGLFVLAALFGVVVLTAVLSDKKTPKFAVVVHGVLAILALIFVFMYIYNGHHERLLIGGVLLLVMAALGGATLLTFDLSKKPIPKAFALGHPVLAMIGLVLLVISFFRSF